MTNEPCPGRRATSVFAAVCILIASATGVAAAVDPVEDFAITDRNSDGFVDRGEFHQRMVEQFFFADEDRDGRLLPVELPGVPPDIFRRADRDGDGALGLTEFTEARDIDFRQVDRNGDGLLSRDEVMAVSAPPPR